MIVQIIYRSIVAGKHSSDCLWGGSMGADKFLCLCLYMLEISYRGRENKRYTKLSNVNVVNQPLSQPLY